MLLVVSYYKTGSMAYYCSSVFLDSRDLQVISYWKGVFVYLSASLTLALQQELAALDCIHRSDSANMFIKDCAGYSYLYTVRNPLCPPCHFGSPVVRIRPIPFLSLAFLHLHNPEFMPLRFAFPHTFLSLFSYPSFPSLPCGNCPSLH